MSTARIASGTSALASAPFAIADGASAILFLASASGSQVPVGSRALVQVQGSNGVWVTVAELSVNKPAYHAQGPAVYRVERIAAASAFGVDQSDATLWPVPVNTVAPAVTGTAEVGEDLTCTTGTWTTTGTTTYAYQWDRGGVDIAGADEAVYTLVEADAGTNITCTVTATNPGGAGTPEPSNTVAVAA